MANTEEKGSLFDFRSKINVSFVDDFFAFFSFFGSFLSFFGGRGFGYSGGCFDYSGGCFDFFISFLIILFS
jgi:hypothetical protein